MIILGVVVISGNFLVIIVLYVFVVWLYKGINRYIKMKVIGILKVNWVISIVEILRVFLIFLCCLLWFCFVIFLLMSMLFINKMMIKRLLRGNDI